MNVDQFVNAVGETVEQGDVVVIGRRQASFLAASLNLPIPEVDLGDRSYDTRVCGIVCEVSVTLKPETEEAPPVAKGKKTAKAVPKSGKARASHVHVSSLAELEALDRSKVESGQIGLMATSGVFPHCKVDADVAPIKVGDLLTTSPTRGHAQKVLDPGKAVGAIIGKALGALKEGKGKIPVLVTLQ